MTPAFAQSPGCSACCRSLRSPRAWRRIRDRSGCPDAGEYPCGAAMKVSPAKAESLLTALKERPESEYGEILKWYLCTGFGTHFNDWIVFIGKNGQVRQALVVEGEFKRGNLVRGGQALFAIVFSDTTLQFKKKPGRRRRGRTRAKSPRNPPRRTSPGLRSGARWSRCSARCRALFSPPAERTVTGARGLGTRWCCPAPRCNTLGSRRSPPCSRASARTFWATSARPRWCPIPRRRLPCWMSSAATGPRATG